MDLIEKVKATILRENLIEKNDKILIGLSGGADSVFLFNILNILKDDLQFDIATCHINHSYRSESYVDEEFSRRISEDKNVKFFLEKVDMKKYSVDNSISLEDSGRILRYRCFNEILKNENFDKIAVAHHMDDQVETFFLHLFRGSGIDGLTGIKYKNKNIIRPLLDITKKEIVDYLFEEKIEYVTDKTNFFPDVLRNKIRLELLPYVQKNFNKSITQSINRTMIILRDSNEIIEDVTDKMYSSLVKKEGETHFIDVKNFKNQKLSVQRNVIRQLLIRLYDSNKDIRMSYIDDIINLFDLKNGNKYLFKDYSFFKSYDKVIIRENLSHKNLKPLNFVLGTMRFGDFTIKSYITDSKNIKPNKNRMIFDAKIISKNLVIRPRKNGDRIKLKGFSKKIKDIFIDEKIEKSLRDFYPILSDESEIYAILSVKRSNLFMKNSDTKEVLIIEVEYEK